MVTRNLRIGVLAPVTLILACGTALAQHGGGGETGEDEGPGSNLSQPLLFPEAVGLSGTAISLADPTTTGLRSTTVPPGYDLNGEFRYLPKTQSVCY